MNTRPTEIKIKLSNTPTYTEAHRNQYHFSPTANWMNDPNGMVYYDGEYHLFYQYNPDDILTGPMHWGHAVSKDMVNWEHLPTALSPDELGYIYSGSAVVDWDNTSGLGVEGKPPMVAIFTQHDVEGEKAKRSDYQAQSIAYSNDKGRTWTKYTDNPVLANPTKGADFRDPKVMWSEQYGYWLMTLAVKDRVHFYQSKNLLDWTLLSEWGQDLGDRKGVWECPDFFPIEVEGEDESKWVLILSLNPGGPQGGSGTQYFVGGFDGKTFTLDEDFAQNVADGQGMWLGYGADNYAGVTWADIPDSDNRRLFIGWMSNWAYGEKVPTENWRSAMTLPRVLALRDTEYGYRLITAPVKEITKLYTDTISLAAQVCKPSILLSEDLKEGVFKMSVSIEKSTSSTFGIKLTNDKGERLVMGLDGATNNLFVDRSGAGKVDFNEQFGNMHFAPLEYESSQMTLDVYVDKASIEVFVDGGRYVMTDIFFTAAPFSKVELIAVEGEIQLLAGNLSHMKGIWP